MQKEEYRIRSHPILKFPQRRRVSFTYNGRKLWGYEGEPIIAALRANGIIKLGHSPKMGLPRGPFCMQGRCASCLMTLDGRPNVMICITPLRAGMDLQSSKKDDVRYFKRLPRRAPPALKPPRKDHFKRYDLAVIGAGPAGLETALWAYRSGLEEIAIFDDKDKLGGQLVLQTHAFFGTEELGAATRGFIIAEKLRNQIERSPIKIHLQTTVVGIYPENLLAYTAPEGLGFALAKKIVLASGASERMLCFEGNYLPGVMGAGAAQIFMNLHGVKPGKNVLIIGGGNIGAILAYQLLQAGIKVAGIVEATERMGAYKVHVNKVKSLGVPIFLRHTIKRALGKNFVEGAIIVQLDQHWNHIPGSEKYLDCDTICIAVGLNPLNELLWHVDCEFRVIPELGEVAVFDRYRRTSNPDIYIAGDCAVVAEASIARLEGRIAGLSVAKDLGKTHPDFEQEMEKSFQLLDSIQQGSFGEKWAKGKARITAQAIPESFSPKPFHQELKKTDFPAKQAKALIDCDEDIPCNPCEPGCKFGAIKVGSFLTQPPDFIPSLCKGCATCIKSCPGRVIRILQYNYDEKNSLLLMPFEFTPIPPQGKKVRLLDIDGREIGYGKIKRIITQDTPGLTIISVILPKEIAFEARNIKLPLLTGRKRKLAKKDTLTALLCRCEEIPQSQVEELIEKGLKRLDEIKRLTRCTMGLCRGLSCRDLIEALIRRKTQAPYEELLLLRKRRPTTFRAPIKNITLGDAARFGFTPQQLEFLRERERKRTIPPDLMEEISTPMPPNRTITKKIVIIGGGISGIFTAWWLLKEGTDGVVLVEKDFLTAGATGACLGGIRTGFSESNKIERAKLGLKIYSQAEKLIGRDIGWYQGGYIYLAFDEKMADEFYKTAPIWERTGTKYKFILSSSELRKLVPGLGTKEVLCAVYFPEAGGANPFLTSFGFAEDAVKKGLQILTGVEVRAIKIRGPAVEGIVMDNGSFIKCDHVVNAAGSWALKISKMAGIELKGIFNIEKHPALVTEKMGLWLDPLVVCYHPTLSGYWQQKRMEKHATEGEIIACYTPQEKIYGFNTSSDPFSLVRIAKAIIKLQPQLSEVGIVRTLAEHYVGRQSGVPLIGPTPLRGFWQNIGKMGHGFMCAPGDGFALAKSIISGEIHPWISNCTLEEKGFEETMI